MPAPFPPRQVFFADSLKFFLSLYGHKLPVLAMDVSSDGTLLLTGSSDKNIKVGQGSQRQGNCLSEHVHMIDW